MAESIKPVIVFQASGRPVGESFSVDRKRTTGLYTFKATNTGPGVATLGDNPFREIDAVDVIKNELAGWAQPQQLISVVEGQRFPNILQPHESINLQIALGHFEDKPMVNPFTFSVYYSDVKRVTYQTLVSIRPDTGDVLYNKASKARRKHLRIRHRYGM